MHFVAFYAEPSAVGVNEIVTRFPSFSTDTDYQNLLAILFRSVELFQPDAKMAVLTDEYAQLDSLPPDVAIVRLPIDPDRVVHSRLTAQIEYLRTHAETSPVVFLDPDIIINADLRPLVAEATFDVALTYRDLPDMPINDGVIVINGGPGQEGLRFLELVRSVYDRQFAGDPYWFGHQRALIATLGKSRFALRPSNDIRLDGIRVRLLPCDQWNFSPEDERAFAQGLRDKRILHFKGERKALMSLYWQKYLDPAKTTPSAALAAVLPDTDLRSPERAPTPARRLVAASRRHIVAATLLVVVYGLLLLVALPEALGDSPYNALGH